ncbi:MAG: DNA polymerase ligase N-terminal domain-containing protein [Bacteroidota bacterium]
MALSTYNKKRKFSDTPEPEGKGGKKNQFRFVVQRHDASHLHYDFRLELGGVLKSWAVPKGPSMNPTDKRLAVMVEDHPVSYFSFEGVIPKGNYGAGTVEVWDKGVFFPVDKDLEKISERQALLGLKKGELKIFLKGEKLEGGFVLVRLHNDDKNWLLIKHKDEYAVKTKYDSEKFSKAATKKVTGRVTKKK